MVFGQAAEETSKHLDKEMRQAKDKIYDYVRRAGQLDLGYQEIQISQNVFNGEPTEYVPEVRYFKPTIGENLEHDLNLDKWKVDYNANKAVEFNSYLDDMRDSNFTFCKQKLGTLKGDFTWYSDKFRTEAEAHAEDLDSWEQYPELDFIKKTELTSLQKQWLGQRPVMVNALRPVVRQTKGVWRPTMEFFIDEKKEYFDEQYLGTMRKPS